eukprot:91713_1
MGKLILGKTYLTGLDNKCFSRTGRVKKGYRNVPIDLQREFEIEKRQIKQIQDMIHPKKTLKGKKKKKQQQKVEPQNNLMLDQKNKNDVEMKENENTDNN